MARGDFSWEATRDACKPYSALAAGLIFGTAWWLLGDAIVYSMTMLGAPFNLLWLLPGIVATFAIMLMNTVTPEDVGSSGGYGDEAATCRSRVVLMLSYLLCIVAVATSVALLLSEKSKEGADGRMWIGASSVMQVCLVCLSGLVVWIFHSSSSYEGYSYL